MNIRKTILVIAALALAATASGQKVALKNNLLYDATTSLNIALELKAGQRTTLHLPVGYNPWTFSDNRKLKHILVQPEFRWWVCEPFEGHFWGVHAHWAFYNVGGIKTPFRNTREYRHQGWLAGAGVSYGYSWILAPRWSIEATIGAGYAYLSYDKYPYQKCAERIGSDTHHYFGITKLGLSLVFMIK